MSWLGRKFKEWRFNRAKKKDLESQFIKIVQICNLKDEHILLKDQQLITLAKQSSDTIASNYAAMTALVVAHNGEFILDKVFIDIVNSPSFSQIMHIDNLPNGGLRFYLQESPTLNPEKTSEAPASPTTTSEGSEQKS